MELFSPAHWDRLLEAVEQGGRRNRRAEQRWSQAYDAWHAENAPRALELFRKVVAEEPGAADGYLGLYALSDGFDESVCQALAHSAERLREYQRRLDKPLNAYYCPLLFEPVVIASPDDARLSLVRYLSKTRQLAAAESWLERCHPTDTRTMALKGRVAFESRRYEEAIAHLQQVVNLDEELRSDAYLLTGLALEELGLFDGALSSVEASLSCAHNEHARRYARYRKALLLERLGDEREARKTFEKIYAEDSSYLDVAARLGLEQPQRLVAPPQSSTPDAWQSLVDELESGRVENDPSIADNR